MFLCVCMLSKRVHQKGKQNVHHVWMVLSWNIQVHEQKNGSGLKYVLTAWSDATKQCGCSCPKWPFLLIHWQNCAELVSILSWDETLHAAGSGCEVAHAFLRGSICLYSASVDTPLTNTKYVLKCLWCKHNPDKHWMFAEMPTMQMPTTYSMYVTWWLKCVQRHNMAASSCTLTS